MWFLYACCASKKMQLIAGNRNFSLFLYIKKNNQLNIKGVNLNPTFWLYIKKKPSMFVTSTECLVTFDVSPFHLFIMRWIIKTGRLAKPAHTHIQKKKKIFPYELPVPAHDSLGDTGLQDCPYGECAWSSETIELAQTWDGAISGWQLLLLHKCKHCLWGRQEGHKGGVWAQSWVWGSHW